MKKKEPLTFFFKVGKEQITNHIEAVNFFILFCATSSNFAKIELETASLKETASKTFVELPLALRSKVAWCGKTYLNEKTNERIIDILPSNTQSALRISRGREQGAFYL